jgi:F-type H+-transporting ATPase subunit b
MFYLLDFEPIKPDIGLIFWTTIIFGLFWLVVGKFDFKPIASDLRQREQDIQSSLDQAKQAKLEMANLKAENEKLLASAREERAKILKEAKDAGEHIVQDAKVRAKDEAQKIVISAKNEIENQKKQALIEVKNQVGNMALDIAEQVLRRKLQDDKEQQELVNTLVKEIKFN